MHTAPLPGRAERIYYDNFSVRLSHTPPPREKAVEVIVAGLECDERKKRISSSDFIVRDCLFLCN
jgi:hypothetical protein